MKILLDNFIIFKLNGKFTIDWLKLKPKVKLVMEFGKQLIDWSNE